MVLAIPGNVQSENFAMVYFRETSHLRSYVKIRHSRNGEITQPVTDVGKSGHSREFLTSQTCILTLFVKLNSREIFWIKILQYCSLALYFY